MCAGFVFNLQFVSSWCRRIGHTFLSRGAQFFQDYVPMLCSYFAHHIRTSDGT